MRSFLSVFLFLPRSVHKNWENPENLRNTESDIPLAEIPLPVRGASKQLRIRTEERSRVEPAVAEAERKHITCRWKSRSADLLFVL